MPKAHDTFQREFLLDYAAWYLACRLAVFGGTPMVAQYAPVTDFRTLGWSLRGMRDYEVSMEIVCREQLNRP